MAVDDPYWVRDNCLWFRTDVLLESSSLPRMEQFARVLNAARPEEERIAATVRALIGMTRGNTYTFGARLLAEGEPLQIRQDWTAPVVAEASS